MLTRSHLARAAEARTDIAADLGGRISPDSLDDLLLVVSELVTNAVVHGCRSAMGLDGDPDVDVSWELRGDEVLVCVSDPSPQLPVRLRPHPTSPGGRGLAIVDCMTRDWGARHTRRGKQVWARVPVHPLPAA
jgi:two-component sensor histidine kinase